jgi:hypothetical protein
MDKSETVAWLRYAITSLRSATIFTADFAEGTDSKTFPVPSELSAQSAVEFGCG